MQQSLSRKKKYVLDAGGHTFAAASKVHDLITCESKVQVVCFPRELMSVSLKVRYFGMIRIRINDLKSFESW